MNDLKVQFAAGGNILDGWDNHDVQSADITKRLPYDDNTVDFILCEHGLEHVNSGHGFLFLKDCYRILKPGGTLRICVPMALNMQDDSKKIDLITGHGHQMVYDFYVLGHFMKLAGFSHPRITERKGCDQHWKTIGLEADTIETLRMEAMK